MMAHQLALCKYFESSDVIPYVTQSGLPRLQGIFRRIQCGDLGPTFRPGPAFIARGKQILLFFHYSALDAGVSPSSPDRPVFERTLRYLIALFERTDRNGRRTPESSTKAQPSSALRSGNFENSSAPQPRLRTGPI
jgi:hypothetical protein